MGWGNLGRISCDNTGETMIRVTPVVLEWIVMVPQGNPK